ncbi:methyl-accepting chemotaxis protein [Eubacterium xylanophilum]|uniref:methyl-accepting chemotaxis protein n=1 Tax=Eubacterium xylanophilum TaxID=39497 RepID=UPI00047B941A|nr:methyl-accepting chemotaxis protein [Eubacterium xylanophilum]
MKKLGPFTKKDKKTKKSQAPETKVKDSKTSPKTKAKFKEVLTTVGSKIVGLCKLIPTLIPNKEDENAPLLDSSFKVLPQFCIQTKLIAAYSVPIILIIVLGIVSYISASSALIGNYEGAVSQTMSTAKDYFDFAFSNIESDMNTYLGDKDLEAFYTGQFSTNEAQKKNREKINKETDALEQKYLATKEGTKEYYKFYSDFLAKRQDQIDADRIFTNAENNYNNAYKSINQSISTKAASNKFIGNIYIFKDKDVIFSSQPKIRRTANNSRSADDSKSSDAAAEDTTTESLGLWKAYQDSNIGKQVMSDPSAFHWTSSSPALDKILLTNADDYIFRVGHDLPTTSDAVVIVDISKDSILDILNNINLGEGSYLGIVSADNTETTIEGASLSGDGDENKDANKAKITKKKVYVDQPFYKEAIESEEESASKYVTFEGTSYLFTYAKLGTTGILLCSLVPEATIVAQANSIRVVTVVIVLLSVIIALVIATGLSKGFSNVINNSLKKLNRVAKGDLTVEFRTSRRDEFALLYGSCNDMLKNMRNLLREVESVYAAVSESLESVNSSSIVFSETTKNIQQSIHEVELGVGDQTESANECLGEMDNLFNKINSVNESTIEISNIASTTKQSATDGLKTVAILNDKTSSTTDITNNVISTIEILSKYSNNIGQIVNTINDIAEETNLLSLNASIEAARAGAAGKGFSVVANQIRKLADQSIISSSKIEQLLEEIKTATNNAVTTAESAEQIVYEQVDAVANSARSFQMLSDTIGKLTEYIESIQGNSKSMEQSGSTTLHSMENISAVLEETLAAVSSIANVTDKQTEALAKLDHASSQLMTRANSLGEAISIFKTR